jgi:hypothetical protein
LRYSLDESLQLFNTADVLFSLANNRLIKQKLKGGQFVQVPNIGYTNATVKENALYGQGDLNFYHIDENGKVQPMEIKVAWNKKWNARKEARRKRRNDFKNKLGVDKSDFNRLADNMCGRRPRVKNLAKYKKCVENLANKIRSERKNEIRNEVSSAPVSVKQEISDTRQKSFASQVTNRTEGGIYGGRRWDGESNSYVESLVDKGLV